MYMTSFQHGSSSHAEEDESKGSKQSRYEYLVHAPEGQILPEIWPFLHQNFGTGAELVHFFNVDNYVYFFLYEIEAW